MNEFNPNCGKCGMLNSRGFCALTACRYPSNVIVAEPKVIRGMMVNPQIEKPMTHFDEIKAMNLEELAVFCEDGCPPGAPICNSVETIEGETVKEHCQRCWQNWLKAPVEVDNG